MPPRPKKMKVYRKVEAYAASRPMRIRKPKLAPQAPKEPKRRGRKPSNAWEKRLSYPGILEKSVTERCQELFYESFSMYAVELVCYDLRRLFPHLITCPLSRDPRPIQDGLDKQIVIHYAPGKPRDKGLLLRIIRGEVPPLPPGYMRELERVVARDRVKFPGRLKECIETRWRALGYKRLSGYVTALIRYDLALGGPHNEANGSIRDPKMLAELDELTAAKFAAGKIERIRLIDFLEEALGRKLTIEESFEKIRDLLKKLRKAAGGGAGTRDWSRAEQDSLPQGSPTGRAGEREQNRDW